MQFEVSLLRIFVFVVVRGFSPACLAADCSRRQSVPYFPPFMTCYGGWVGTVLQFVDE